MVPSAAVPVRPTSFDPRDPDYAARVRSTILDHPFLRLLGAECSLVAPGHCRIEAPFDPRLGQQHGTVHAGAQATLADSAGGGAAASLMPPGYDCVAVEFKMHFLRPARGERLVADAYVVRPGRRVTVCDLEVHMVTDGRATLTLKGLQTVMAVPPLDQDSTSSQEHI